MRSTSCSQWRRFGAVTSAFLLLALLAGCSGSPAKPTSSPTGTTPTATALGAPKAPTATQVAAQALAATRAIRSYLFRASQTLTGGPHPRATTISGRAVRPSSVSYTLVSGSRSQSVVKIGRRLYRRVPPGGWKLIATPTPSVDPLRSLLTLLPGIRHATLTGRTLSGDVPAQVLILAGLAPVGGSAGAAAPVTISLDAAGRVASLRLVVTIAAKGHRLLLTETTAFSGFNIGPQIKAPI